MKAFFVVWAGLWRMPMRTALTLASLVIAFLLFGLLQGVNSAIDGMAKNARSDRLLVDPRFNNPLSRTAADQLARVPGVVVVTGAVNFSGYYQDPANRLGLVAADPTSYFRVHDELRVDPEHLKALVRTRTGLLVLEGFAHKMGWKIGDQVPLVTHVPRSDDGSWIFQIVGFLRAPEDPAQVPIGILNYDYFNDVESLPGTHDKVARLEVRIADARRAAEIGKAIDKLFVNSEAPSRTQIERDFVLSFMARLGDLQRLTEIVIGAVFFSMLFLVANVVRQAARERTPEFAILKTLGYSDSSVFGIVVGETLILCLIGAAIGLAITAVAFPSISRHFPMLRGFVGTHLSYSVLFSALIVAVLLTGLSAALPAWRAMRLKIVDALRMSA